MRLRRTRARGGHAEPHPPPPRRSRAAALLCTGAALVPQPILSRQPDLQHVGSDCAARAGRHCRRAAGARRARRAARDPAHALRHRALQAGAAHRAARTGAAAGRGARPAGSRRSAGGAVRATCARERAYLRSRARAAVPRGARALRRSGQLSAAHHASYHLGWLVDGGANARVRGVARRVRGWPAGVAAAAADPVCRFRDLAEAMARAGRARADAVLARAARRRRRADARSADRPPPPARPR